MANDNEIIKVDSIDLNENCSEIADSEITDSGNLDRYQASCMFNGQWYSKGSRICSGGVLLRCGVPMGSFDKNSKWIREGKC